jgi:hypothetical protein
MISTNWYTFMARSMKPRHLELLHTCCTERSAVPVLQACRGEAAYINNYGDCFVAAPAMTEEIRCSTN